VTAGARRLSTTLEVRAGAGEEAWVELLLREEGVLVHPG